MQTKRADEIIGGDRIILESDTGRSARIYRVTMTRHVKGRAIVKLKIHRDRYDRGEWIEVRESVELPCIPWTPDVPEQRS